MCSRIFSLANLLRRLGQPSRAAAHFSVARRLLDASAADAPLPTAKGLTAGRLREIIDATERIHELGHRLGARACAFDRRSAGA